jgi:TolB-like protein
LPFENLTGDSEQEYFSDGLTDALITELAKVSALKVISRTSSMQYKGVRASLPNIARDLGVSAVLEGSVQRENGRVRVLVQLISAETDGHIWAESYDEDSTSVLVLQNRVAVAVVGAISARLTPREKALLSRRTTVNAESYDRYLLGMSQVHRFTPEGLQVALAHFQAALEIEPHSALAHSGIANVLAFSSLLGAVRPRDAGPRAVRAAAQATELDPTLAQGFAATGFLAYQYEWDWPKAEGQVMHAHSPDRGW